MINRRFTGTCTLYQDDFDKFSNAHVIIIGIGGVGSWATEALARTGIGELTLIDMDVLVESNVNRQLPALTDTFGESKIGEMTKRVVGINPAIKINAIDEFITPDNIDNLLPSIDVIKEYKAKKRPLIILDCVDDMNAKLAIVLYCRFNKVKLIISGGAGGKIDPLQIKVSDLKDVYQDPLLAKLRQNLRDKNINKSLKEKFGMKCVYSSEPLKLANACESGLNCGGYGSAVTVTASVGMIMASECLKMIGNF
ncbi:tRNA threonylcarbamoyladenosine dehydratase [Moraxella bovis]|uniref:tRNA threonylcarbamoyladenosine dehydratase n=1 Tax=Moraxella bovis TaxID=476 RepID=UPI002226F598|nr:tRNA threonylcarbamoyladenosine dehydratase [Moraxella bovis]UYZ68704.1 tRNA threonylcarbamoyladenosine dehydratase [Moraxella bovis]UYZ71080.1 tRNA threonylcarbamoyladenosine dehydratase [Moraxella bovis]UYZ73002.1 tRNA threonylcarbamoyladenosine dehydratase [Moraxella bovis]UZA14375.1 tRNA threonylcarbamoyladenosine dehydratase [Moraxella bovis]UZA27265.1 tRNA threonylcarbamoyladenosine dehydratase [Moraxella bovis]